MKKRFLSMLMAICLMLTLAPAVLAVDNQPDTITLPNGEVREIPTLEPDPIMPTSVSELTIDTDGYYVINNIQDFQKVIGSEWYANHKFRIKGDLNLSTLYTSGAEWTGIIQYFLGTLEGVLDDYDNDGTERYPIIEGIPNNCCLIYGIIGGTIQNLTFKYAGQAAFITMMPVSYGSSTYPLILRNVTIEGSVLLTGSDQSNYSPFVYSASTGGLQMYNCTNNATISGSIYGSVFHGYYPILDGAYVFDGCKNNGTVSLNYAGMFFGNSSNLESRLASGAVSLTIKNCENNGILRGTQGAKYLSAPVGLNTGDYTGTSNTQKVESLLNPLVDDVDGAAAAYPNVEEISGTGQISSVAAGSDFEVALNGDTIAITHPTSTTDIANYTVTVGAYVNLWDTTLNSFQGTDRVSISQTISASSFTSNNPLNASVKAYGFADSNFGTTSTEIINNGFVQVQTGADGTKYYKVDNTAVQFNAYRHYVSSATTVGENDVVSPVGGGTRAADFITVAAYDSNGVMLGAIQLR